MLLFVALTTFCGLAMIGGAAAASAPLNNPAPRAQTPFSFDDIFSAAYRAKGFSGSWINETFYLYRDEYGNVKYVDATTNAETIFVQNNTFVDINSGTYFVSNDLQYVLFAYERTALWRHSFNAKYAAYNVASKVWTFLPNNTELLNKTLQYCNWSPSGHSLAFVYNNDLYYQSDPGSVPQRITDTGEPNPLYIFNGVPDWLYEEDVLSDRVTHYWSQTNTFILYAELNDTEVPLQPWPWYGSKSQVYPRTIQIAYPKAGDVRNDGTTAGPNTKVKLFIADTADVTVKKQLLPPAQLRDVDHYYLQVEWRNESTVMVTWANRVQNESYSIIYNAAAENTTELDGQENLHLAVSGGWVEVPPATPWFIKNGAEYLTVLPQDLTPGNPWRNLARVSAPDDASGTVTWLMNSTQEVEYIIGYNPSNGSVYFVSTNGDPLERHIMRVNASGDNKQTPVCVTCGMPASCRYMSGSFSHEAASYYFLNCHGPDVPTYRLRNIANESYDHMLEDNHELTANLKLKLLPTREFKTVPLKGNYTGRAEIFWPPGHVPGNKYPLLVYAYAGPGSQRVMKTFPMGGSTSNWLMYLKSTHNIAVMSIDGRGSMAAGDKMKFEMYRNLSTVEVEDQIAGGDYFRALTEIDDTISSAIFGWSYGGGVAAHVIGDKSKTFMCGISVAPVTTKAYYDTAYTERYLGLATKSDNELGYNNTDVMSKASNFLNKTYMIAHGTADDNVHFMHAVQLIRTLADTGVKFRQNLYADQNHGINSPGQSRHLYASMTDVLLNDCWPTKPSSGGTISSAVFILPNGSVLLTLAAISLILNIRRLM